MLLFKISCSVEKMNSVFCAALQFGGVCFFSIHPSLVLSGSGWTDGLRRSIGLCVWCVCGGVCV